MGFKGVDEYTTNKMIKTKISNFLKNIRRRAKPQGEPQSFMESQMGNQNFLDATNCGGFMQENQDVAIEAVCLFCSSSTPLGSHLHQNETCLVAYIKSCLPHQRRVEYRDNYRRAIFDLSLLLFFCPSQICTGDPDKEGYASHVRGSCLQFYLSEAPVLYTRWAQIRSPEDLLKKLKNRRDYLKRQLRDVAQQGISMYRLRLKTALVQTCNGCCLHGPLLDIQEYTMVFTGNSETSGEPLWHCSMCRESNQTNPVESSIQKMIALGSPSEEYDDTLKPIEVKDIVSDETRIVFVPSQLAANQTVVDYANLLLSTTVLVPKTPEALDIIGDDSTKRSKEEKVDLVDVSIFLSKRPLLCHPSIALSVLYRKKLADIALERLKILGAMSRTSVGKIVSRNPNVASINVRNPHYNATRNLCLTKTCQWSEAHQDMRSGESAAISNVAGQIKFKVKIQILNKLANDNPELRAVLFNMMRHHRESFALIGTAPIVLQHLRVKIKLLLENVIECAFENWDLDNIFEEHSWTVFLVGFLYSQDFEEINREIALHGASLRKRTDAVTSKPTNAPTVSLNSQNVADLHAISRERAEVVVALARKVQIGDTAHPLSMFTIITPDGLVISEDERYLRDRAVQLGLQCNEQTSCEDAIRGIALTLDAEGLNMVEISDDLAEILASQRYGEIEDAILRYHNLIWRTAGDKECTLPRACGESYVIPYIPVILEATQMFMRADVVIGGESRTNSIPELKNDIARCLSQTEDEFSPESWREVSILDFIHSSLPDECKFKGLTRQSIVPVISSRNSDLKWREAVDNDNQKGEEIFITTENKEYVRTDGDIRKLYGIRPAPMRQMTLGQFASEYRLLYPAREGYEAAKSTIDEHSKIGHNSNLLVAGTRDLWAPQTMMLLNGGIMKMRSERAALNIHKGGKTNKYISMLLWSPWTELEQVNGEQNEDETEEQKQRRLSVFPASVFPTQTIEDDSIEML